MPDVGAGNELRHHLDGQSDRSGDPGQGLGLVRAQVADRAGLASEVPRLEGVAVDEDEERVWRLAAREVPRARPRELAADAAAADEDHAASHSRGLPAQPAVRPG